MILSDKTVLITGATGGIGSALAATFVNRGARVVLVARDASQVAALAKRIGEQGEAVGVTADLSTPGGRMRVVEAATAHNIDILVNNAGISAFGEFQTTPESTVESIMQTNAIAPMLITRSLLPHLNTRSHAMVVNIGSTFGAIGFPGYAAYCASKHALRGFSEALARELRDSSVDVLYVSPRATATGMNCIDASKLNDALGTSVDQPETVATTIVHAIEHDARRTQLGWPERLQVMLNTTMPSLVDRALQAKLSTIRQYLQRAQLQPTLKETKSNTYVENL